MAKLKFLPVIALAQFVFSSSKGGLGPASSTCCNARLGTEHVPRRVLTCTVAPATTGDVVLAQFFFVGFKHVCSSLVVRLVTAAAKMIFP
jgi:hypothetical protein